MALLFQKTSSRRVSLLRRKKTSTDNLSMKALGIKTVDDAFKVSNFSETYCQIGSALSSFSGIMATFVSIIILLRIYLSLRTSNE